MRRIPLLLAGLAACSIPEPTGSDPGPAPAPTDHGDEESYLDALEADYDRNARRAVPRDSFDVLDDPPMVPATEATTLDPDEHVLGVEIGGEACAYPIGALGNSELVNDTCGGVPIAASW